MILTKKKDEPPRYSMAADLTSNEIDGFGLFQALVVVRAAMEELNEMTEKLNGDAFESDGLGQKGASDVGK